MQLPPPPTPAENGFGELASLPLRRKLCTCSPFSPSSSGCLSSRKMRNLKIRCCHVMPPMTLNARRGGTRGGTQVCHLCHTPLSQGSARAPGRQGAHTRLTPSSGGGSTPVGDMQKRSVGYETQNCPSRLPRDARIL